MAQITSLLQCFDVNIANKYISSLDQVISELKYNKENISSKWEYFGKDTFYFGNCTPIQDKMTNISSKIDETIKKIQNIEDSIMKNCLIQRRQDLQSYIVYCDEMIKSLNGKTKNTTTLIGSNSDYQTFLSSIERKKQSWADKKRIAEEELTAVRKEVAKYYA